MRFLPLPVPPKLPAETLKGNDEDNEFLKGGGDKNSSGALDSDFPGKTVDKESEPPNYFTCTGTLLQSYCTLLR